MPTIAVVGSGAVGQFYGAQAIEAGHRVRFIARRDLERLRSTGLVIRQTPTPQVASTARTTDLRIAPDRFSAFGDGVTAAADGPVDLVLVAVKTTAIDQVRPLVEPLLGPSTYVVALCNGLGVEDELAAWAGADRVGGMLCFVCINRDDDGTVHHLAHGQVTVGDFRDDPRRRQRLAELCASMGLAHHLPEVLLEARWRKLVWNLPFNGLGVMHDATVDRILANPQHMAEARLIMGEAIAVANGDLAAHGHVARIESSWSDEQLARTRLMGAYVPSTLLDHRAGRPLELEALFAEPLRRAQRLGMSAPALERLLAGLRCASFSP